MRHACLCAVRSVVAILLSATVANIGGAQCRLPAASNARRMMYTFEAAVAPTATVLHITLQFPGTSAGAEELDVPTHWAGQTLHGMTNLRALSPGAVISDDSLSDRKVLRYPANRMVVIAYDLQKDWTGPFRHPLQFHAVIMPEYVEITGANSLVHPRFTDREPITVAFDWTRLPTTWALATSFGASAGVGQRCQTYSGVWRTVEDALFAAGDFRIHRFQIGEQAAVLAIRGPWTFTDDEAIAGIRTAVGVVRDFWHEYDFPYFLVTWKPYDTDRGSSDGSAFTNAFWIYMSRLDPLSTQLTQLSHETFHAWDVRRMGNDLDGSDPMNVIDWFHEGFTTYYADVLVYRAGLMSLNTYVANTNANLRNLIVLASASPYVRGRAIALWLDGVIRATSNNTRSLDNVMFDMRHEGNRPLTQARILETIGRYLPADARQQLEQTVLSGAPVPAPSTAALGRCAEVSMTDVPTFDLGFDYAASIATQIVTGVRADGPASTAGLREGQRLIKWSVYNGQAERPARFVVSVASDTMAIEYYPRGRSVAVPQYHIDEAAYAVNPEACKNK